MPFNVQAKDWETPPDPPRAPRGWSGWPASPSAEYDWPPPLTVAISMRPPSSFLLHASDADAKRLFDLTGSVLMNALIMKVGLKLREREKDASLFYLIGY